MESPPRSYSPSGVEGKANREECKLGGRSESPALMGARKAVERKYGSDGLHHVLESYLTYGG